MESEKIYMISEIGINHSGDLQIAKKLIDATFACGWDCVKFQKRTPEKCVPEIQKNVPRITPWGTMSYLEYKKKLEFGEKEYDYIDSYCREKPISWTASVWDEESLKFILKYSVPFIKIPSAMVTNIDLIKMAAGSGKKIIMSTGMSTVQEMDEAVEILVKTGCDFTLMHTNSTYPTPLSELNLNLIPWLKNRYNCTVGYSGHEFGLEPTVIAVALGARVIERHVTLDHTMWGTDQAASLEVHAMDMLNKRIKDVLVSMGDGVKSLSEGETKIREKLRG